jgi:hypothetical protein
LCGGDVAIRAAQQVAGTAPIVAVTDDMVSAGFVQTLVKPAKLADTQGVKLLIYWVAQPSEIVGAIEAAHQA